MKRDATVWICLLMLAVPWAIGLTLGMPREVTAEDPTLFHVLFWIMFAGAIRLTILWFQTLIHGVKHAREENRVAVVLGHIFLGPIMSIGYYIASRENAKSESARAT